jgi:hypothetical protein
MRQHRLLRGNQIFSSARPLTLVSKKIHNFGVVVGSNWIFGVSG